MVELKPPVAQDQPKPKRSYKKKKLETSTSKKQTNNINNYFKPKITTTIEDNPIQDNRNEDNIGATTHERIGLSSASNNKQLLVGRCISVSESDQPEDVIFVSNSLSNSDSDSVSNFNL